MQEPKQNKDSITADVGELGAEAAIDGVIEGVFEVAGAVGDVVLSGAGELVGGILEGI